MLNARVAWLSLAGALAVSIGLGQGCSGADGTNDASATSGSGVCGDGLVQGTEQCDDGNTNDNDSCSNSCTLAGCGDGIVQAGEECDDGNTADDDACANDCSNNNTNCGNGTPDECEDCDTGGQDTADCDGGDCTLPECGDGYVNQAAGETCEPGELGECPDCGGGGAGGGGCEGQAVYAGMVTNDAAPSTPGPGIGAVWSFGGEKGIQAGIDMCQAIGADHVCTYAEVLAADAAGELAAIPQDTEFWVHRVSTPVAKLGGQAGMSLPGAGARCNDWEYPTGHIADGEFGAVGIGLNTDDNSVEIGNLTFFFDNDAQFSGVEADGHQCGGVDTVGPGTAGCAGNCGGAVPKAIFCCYPQCIE